MFVYKIFKPHPMTTNLQPRNILGTESSHILSSPALQAVASCLLCRYHHGLEAHVPSVQILNKTNPSSTKTWLKRKKKMPASYGFLQPHQASGNELHLMTHCVSEKRLFRKGRMLTEAARSAQCKPYSNHCNDHAHQ